MRFMVLPVGTRNVPDGPNEAAYLISDNWNDYWKFQTLYHLRYRDKAGVVHYIGPLKIGQFNWGEERGRPAIPQSFDSLSEAFFSLGASDEYYTNLVESVPFAERVVLLRSLRDMVQDRDLFARALPEEVTNTSILRDVSPSTVRGQFRRILNGEARLTKYNFALLTQQVSSDANSEKIRIGFSVVPESMPPTNVHVLIGRNGVGKTLLLDTIRTALLNNQANASRSQAEEEPEDPIFASVVTVSFSAFDEFKPASSVVADLRSLRYSYIGLRYPDPEGDGLYLTKTAEALALEFGDAVELCLQSVRKDRWDRALSILQADPLFMRQNLANWSDRPADGSSARTEAVRRFKRLSSGHKIVLLTITKLVATVEESTVVMLDEPEAHLHPPLLSAFVRSLSDLLINRNGVAIVATHSPVVLQEVPRSCVWVLERSGYRWSVNRPSLETFGENVSVLTEEVFGLEVTQAGFHTLIQSAVAEGLSYAEIIRRFDGQLGGEAKAIVQALVSERDVDAV